MPLSSTGAARSFWVMLFCLPCFLLLQQGATESPRALLAALAGFVAGWAGFALASLAMAQTIGRDMLWPRMLATWNWMNLLQYVLLSLGMLLLPEGLPAWLVQGLGLAGVGYALWLQWFALRLALQTDGRRALGFVLLDLMISIFLSGLVAGLSRG